MRPLIASIILLLPFAVFSQADEIPSDEASIARGRALYIDHCDRCHKIGHQEIGPSLASVVDKRPVPWLLNFIQSSQGVIESGDKYAEHLYRSYHNMVMPDFMELRDIDRMDILAYIKAESLGENHSRLMDSLQRANAAYFEKAEHRYADVEKDDSDYYTKEANLEVPTELSTIQQGQKIFEEQCDVCHDLDRRRIGPALASVTDRRPVSWLLDFLDSPTAMLEKGDDYSIFLVSNYPMIMPDFSYLSQDDKLAVLAYIKNASGALTHTAGVNANDVTDRGQDTTSLKSGSVKTGDMDEIGYKDDMGYSDEDADKTFGMPAGMIMGAVVLMLAILAWRILRK